MTCRNSNGEGSVFRRKDGRWAAAVYVTTTSGASRRVHAYAHTKAEARARLAKILEHDAQGIRMPDTAWTVGSYLDYWLKEVAPIARRPRTIELYESRIRLYIKPNIGKLSLQQLSVMQVQKFLNELGERGTSLRTVQQVRTALSAALTRAMREEIVIRNVARLAELAPAPSRNIAIWDARQTRHFLRSAAAHQWYPAFTLVALYGLRRGEVLGLRWMDIDIQHMVNRVRQQLQRVGRSLHTGDVKTKAGQRALPIIPGVLPIIEMHRQREMVKRGAIAKEDLVFTSTTGNPVEPGNLPRAFHILARRAGLPRVTFHSLRHSTATLLKQVRVAPRDAQIILGHASVTTTQQIYQHGDKTMQESGLRRIGEILSPTPKSSNHCCHGQLSSHCLIHGYLQNLSGGPSGTRTHDTLLKSMIDLWDDSRIPEVAMLVSNSLRLRVLGSAAVSRSCQMANPRRFDIASRTFRNLRNVISTDAAICSTADEFGDELPTSAPLT